MGNYPWKRLANGIRVWKGNGNTTALLFSLKRLVILHQERTGQVSTIVMEHFKSILFHKSGSGNKQHTYESMNRSITIKMRKFFQDNKVITEMESWYSSKSPYFNKNSIKGLFHLHEKCVVIGQYLEVKYENKNVLAYPRKYKSTHNDLMRSFPWCGWSITKF